MAEKTKRSRRPKAPTDAGPPAPFPPLIYVDEIAKRLAVIFPVGVPAREYILNLRTARTVFSALYVGAVEGSGRWWAPRHFYRMADAIAERTDETSRLAYYESVPRSTPDSWYADNSREGGRDEGVRRGLIPLNAIVVLSGVATTSNFGRYALARAFAALLDPGLNDAEVAAKAAEWRNQYLSPAALARASLLQANDATSIEVRHPEGGSTVLPAGESPWITKQVVEVFAKRFLVAPRVVWISDSRNKRFSNDVLARNLKIDIDQAKLLPDLILVDMEPPGRSGELLIVFVEIVSTDGPMDELRRKQLLELISSSPLGYVEDDAVFVTAYADRASAPAGRAMRQLAWDSFAWFASEPEHIVHFETKRAKLLAAPLNRGNEPPLAVDGTVATAGRSLRKDPSDNPTT